MADPEAVRSPIRRDECDLVMKGGITSGVAYPAAVLALSERYDFRCIGGASAGAIAAAVTAAAQYARQDGGMQRLREVQRLLKGEGLLVDLFQPTREARPLLDLLLAVQSAESGLGKSIVFVRRVLGRLMLPVAVFVAFVFAVLATLIRLAGGSAESMTGWGWLLLTLLLVLSALFGFVLVGSSRVIRLLRGLSAGYYGLCIGRAEGRTTRPALTEWLYSRIQEVSGQGEHEPLTFAQLEGQAGNEVRLRMMTTDLTLARPVRYPLPEGHSYLFSPDEWRSFFPDPVVDFLADDARCPVARPADEQAPLLRRLPTGDLPIIVATRMSLAFPVLLSAVPVWQLDGGVPTRHWMSDGGISSNFPIHFFDAWLPRRPTFGLNLVPETRVEKPPASTAEAVETYTAAAAPPLRRARITSVSGLLSQILDTMQNWRDTLQAELPGFRDRIAHIRLEAHEGGMNITMPPEAVDSVDQKGRKAGEELRGFDFREHWVYRYLGLMREIQTKLDGKREGPTPDGVRAAFTRELAGWLASGSADDEYGLDLGSAWYAEAVEASEALLKDAGEWLPKAGSFAMGDPPEPAGVMRMTPDV